MENLWRLDSQKTHTFNKYKDKRLKVTEVKPCAIEIK